MTSEDEETTMKVLILCGGKGTRIKEETEYKPKPMVQIGGRPILWHIMKTYARHGFTEFVLALGFKGSVIKDYFLNYECYNSDFSITLGRDRDITLHGSSGEAGWRVTMVDTGEEAMTGARVKRCERYLDGDEFMMTYGDGLTDLPIDRLLAFHRSHGKIGTITGVNPPSRFGEMVVDGKTVTEFREKPITGGSRGDINGGFMAFRRGFLDYVSADGDCVLEREPLEKLAADRQLMVYHHDGFWHCMDTYRDYLFLNQMWQENPLWAVEGPCR